MGKGGAQRRMWGSLPEGPLISLLFGQLLPKGRSHSGRSFKMPVTIIAEAGVNHNGSLPPKASWK